MKGRESRCRCILLNMCEIKNISGQSCVDLTGINVPVT